MNLEFKPISKTKIKLFANTSEAVVFWICIAGLIFLAVFSFFRYHYLKAVVDEYNSLAPNINPISIRIDSLIAENDSLRRQQDNLKLRLEFIQSEANQLRFDLIEVNKELEEINLSKETDPEDIIITLPEF